MNGNPVDAIAGFTQLQHLPCFGRAVVRQHEMPRPDGSGSHGGIRVDQVQIAHVTPGLPAIAGLRDSDFSVHPVVAHQGQPMCTVQRQQVWLKHTTPLRHACHSFKPAVGIKPQGHRVLHAEFKIHRQHHAPIGQHQRRTAHQMAYIPPPGQRQHARLGKNRLGRAVCQGGADSRRFGLLNMQYPTGRPAARASGHHKQMHPSRCIQPGYRVTQTAQAKTQQIADSVAVDDKMRRAPLLAAALKTS